MENVITWVTTYWPMIIGGAYIFVSAAGDLTGMVDGPKADKVSGIFDMIKLILRRLGGGTFKDEPGTNSVPLIAGDTGERVT
jgi:hypothetical protein